MRGKLRYRHYPLLVARIIPAHAGQTTSGLPGSVTSSDHPRACGANVEMHASLGSHVGSSPRMRGKLRQQLHVPELFRIIPAHAGQTVSIVPRSFASRFAGSSPRMRGKLLHAGLQLAQHRIIPAHAGQTRLSVVTRIVWADHPRACGANLHTVTPRSNMPGSSPRMRGKPGRGRPIRARIRIIPAHAGQTDGECRNSANHADHPRACGANLASRRFHHGLSGSSPRMRGKHDRYGHAVAQRRIIPAHAGQTALSSSSLVNATDHPRACGANGGLPMAFSWLTGSSPRMRGKRVEPVCDGAEVRIIPAHAGQTAPNRQDACPCPDHPRACGANRRYGRFSTRPVGSSPRMRGKRPVHHRVHADLRIIPAHAGQTPCSPRAARRWTDHPRACGANVFLAVDMPAEAGSSPRMRGKPGGWVERRHSRRIIPAHAGQTPGSSCSRAGYPDHPRACGANDRHRHQGAPVRGSSPRMRGKLGEQTLPPRLVRIIPAHAGQTCPRLIS